MKMRIQVKILLVFIFSSLVGEILAQNNAGNTSSYSPVSYKQLKAEGKIPKGPAIITNTDTFSMPMTAKIQPPSSSPQSVLCTCMIPIDASFQVAPFQSFSAPDYRNDDGSTPPINIPFNFCFYGQTMNSCYINNNGNISFLGPYATFSSFAFPDPNFIIIYHFWGDVDTQDPLSGIVYYKVTPTSLIVRWQTVGYYSSHSDLLNDFQLIITDGNDPILPTGNNVSFCYGDMQWTTGDASSGVGGFGGDPATVGVNRGNGVDFIQIGQFDAPGTAYDGPFGNPDQVSWLDNQTFYFNVCNNNSGNNIPPIVNCPQVCDTIVLCIGDTADINATFLSPEQGQITVANITGTLLGLTITSNNSGNPAIINGQLIANAANVGYNTITLTGTDDGTPAATTTAFVIVDIISAPAISFSMTPPAPQPMGVNVQFTDNTPGATSWYWDFGDGNTSTAQNPTHVYANDSLYIVSLTVQVGSGCNATLTQVYLVHTDYSVIAPNVVTPNGDGNNDALEFINLNDYPYSRLEVFNRWGNLIYTSSDYHNDWKPNVVDGVYYFILTGPKIQKPVTGFFHVIRDK